MMRRESSAPAASFERRPKRAIGLVTMAVVAMTVVTGAIGCSGSERQTKAAEAKAALEKAADEAPAEVELPPPLYDAEGNLLPSGQSIAWLELPRGLELQRQERNRHIYLSKQPLGRLQRFFGPRVLTGEITSVGEGTIYRAAKSPRGEGPQMDVSILPSSRGVRVEIRVKS